MNPSEFQQPASILSNLPISFHEYTVDSWQRSVLFCDLLRRRGNQYFDHIIQGRPPVLVFDYEMVMEGRTLARPVNYSIVRIINRRARTRPTTTATTNRRQGEQTPAEPIDPQKRPIVVIDPRAGQGPGIGGSKMDSQIGVALNAGHPVYFILFSPEPVKGQTLADVQQAEIRFLEEVIRRHPEAEPPAIIGNCQAGWATALIGADRPDVTGPMVLNGSPLSYWGGVDGKNPMRYRGGLLGGTWFTSLCCDLGHGTFDGAHLVYNFEQLNPANTLWTKLYNVYSKVDTEEKRFLSFEKWWGGFFHMTREEIHFIVDSLFVGNELEQGYLRLEKDRLINLKNFRDPIVVFASTADRITPPQQALNWICKVYKTVDEIKRNGQVIVYILHDSIGHLGIFVGSSVARKEHSAIIGTIDMIEFLAPGLYEMTISEETDSSATDTRQIEFVERTIEDILKMDDGFADEDVFAPVAAVSRFNDRQYLTFVSPWIRMLGNEGTAILQRQLHPLRVERSMLSDLNPALWPCHFLAPWVRDNRRPVSSGNPFLLWEETVSSAIRLSLDTYRDWRDHCQRQIFNLIYDSDWSKVLFAENGSSDQTPDSTPPRHGSFEKDLWLNAMSRGSFAAAVVRVILAMATADGVIDRTELLKAQEIINRHERLNSLKPVEIKRLIREQAGFITYDRHEAIKTLPSLLPAMEDRHAVMAIAESIAGADNHLHLLEMEVLEEIRTVLFR